MWPEVSHITYIALQTSTSLYVYLTIMYGIFIHRLVQLWQNWGSHLPRSSTILTLQWARYHASLCLNFSARWCWNARLQFLCFVVEELHDFLLLEVLYFMAFTQVELRTVAGLVKDSTQCAPNGYYFVPVYDKVWSSSSVVVSFFHCHSQCWKIF